MKLKFLHLSIENFLSLGSVELDLNDMGYTLVKGINNNPNDSAVSNGVGKSAIFDALVWALTGETIRGISRNISNIHTQQGASVCATFLVDNVEYAIRRSKDHNKYGTSLQIFINGEDKSGKGIRDSERLLAEYLPDLTLQFIGSVIVFGQGLPQRFTNNTPSGRKDVLEKLSRSDFMIEDLKERLATRKIALNGEIRKLEDSLLELSSKRSVMEMQLDGRQRELQNLEQIDELHQSMARAETSLQELSAQREEAQAKQEELETELNLAKEGRAQECNSLATQQAAIVEKYAQTLEQLQSSKYQLNGQIQALRAEIERLKKVVDVCPTCGQKLPNVHKVDTTEREQELTTLQQSLAQVSSQIDQVAQQKKDEISALQRPHEERLLTYDNNIMSLERSLQTARANLSTIDQKQKHWSEIYAVSKARCETLEQHRQELQYTIETFRTELTKMAEQAGYINKDKDDLKARLEVINKMTSIATREFRGFLLSNVINYINSRAKIYSKDIFGTDKISFVLNGNNIDISYDDKLYENLSGGESQKVNIIINLSLRDMLCQFSNFSSNILVLDEITDALDALGCSRVIDVITKRLADIESVFIITHRAELMVPADNTITLCKDADGISSIMQ